MKEQLFRPLKLILGDGFTCIPQFESSNQAGKFSESGEAGTVNYGGDRAEEFDGALGQYSFDGQFDGSNRFEYGQGNNNGDMFYGIGDYDYSAGWDSDYFADTGMTMVIDSNGKIGVNKPSKDAHDTQGADPFVQTSTTLIHGTTTDINGGVGLSQPLHDVANVGTHPHYDSDNLTRYWSFMHRLWGQASANQREFIDPLGREVTETGETAVTDGTELADKRVYGEDKPLQQGTTNPTSTGEFNDWIGEPYSLNALTSAESQAGNVYQPSRWFGYHQNNKDVTNNLSKGSTSEHLEGRFLFAGDGKNDRIEMLRGRHGKTLYDLYGGFNGGATSGVPVGYEPWDILNSHNRDEFEDSTTGRQRALPTSGAHDNTWGFSRGNVKIKDGAGGTEETLPPFGEMGRNLDEQIFVDTGFFDSSWELGKPLLGQHVDPRGTSQFQQDQRWFEGINEYGAVGSSVVTVGTDNASTHETVDKAKMKCWHCEVQYSLHWDPTNKHFYTTNNNNKADVATGSEKEGYGAWGDCERDGESRVCEYSSGVCFVEERRTFGYITLVRKGCKQAQACYMQKYQNFLVQAGRQCWPADGSDSSMKVAARPHDIMADQWIYNLVSGGNPYEYVVDGQWNDFMDVHWPRNTPTRAETNMASTFDFKYNVWNDGVNDANIYNRHEFDNTFVDVDPDGQVDRSVEYSTFKKMKEIHGPTFGFYKVKFNTNI